MAKTKTAKNIGCEHEWQPVNHTFDSESVTWDKDNKMVVTHTVTMLIFCGKCASFYLVRRKVPVIEV